MIMHHCAELKRGREERGSGWNRYEQRIPPLHCGKGIYYGEIMIYVNGGRDVSLSKGWRCEPIMINALHSRAHPAPQCTPLWPEVKLFSTSLHPSTALFLFSVFTTQPSSCLALPSSLFSTHVFLSFFFFFHSRYSPLFFSGVAAHLLLSIPCDLCCCSWWIPMIQRFREQGARQSPLSCGWAICLCQTSPPPQYMQHGPDSEQEEEEGMRKRNGEESAKERIKYTETKK